MGGVALAVGSHNVRSLSGKVVQITRLWRRLRWDVVLVQEHRVQGIGGVVRIAGALRGWTPYWSHHNGNGSVAIFIRTALISTGQLRVAEEGAKPSAEGRLITLEVGWGGHRLLLASAHLPNDHGLQRAWISTHLKPLERRRGTRTLLLGGDFNISVGIDRFSAAGAVNSQENSAARHLEAELPTAVDVFRHRHPSAKCYTHFSTGTAARLDRFYISAAAVDYVFSCRARPNERQPGAGVWLSDHRPIVLKLVARQTNRPRRAPNRRIRSDFLKDEALVEDLTSAIRELSADMPSDESALLAWYPGFKKALHAAAQRCARRWRESAVADIHTKEAAVFRAMSAAEAGRAGALEEVIAARTACREAAASAAAEEALRDRRSRLHARETPNPRMTAALQAPGPVQSVSALLDHHGNLVDDPEDCAEVLIKQWAAVSAVPSTASATREVAIGAVTAALHAASSLTEEDNAGLGQAAVTEMEILRALRASNSRSVPGEDGLPMSLYRRCKDVLVPVLAAVFSAMGATGLAPAAFTDGIISPIYKTGPRADPANYRPITLLNADYRLLTKVLATRLGPVLPKIIDPQQTAFLQGRRMGDNIQLLQFLPHLLAAEGRQAFVVFCDIKKAYDTVDREFLYQTMQALGVGPGFMRWVRLLLTDTRAAALVTGCVSRKLPFLAGVRQGCPLAPLLYLFVGQALTCFLRARGMGIQVAGRRLLGSQFADDFKALLEPQETQVASLTMAMSAFGDASNQRMHAGKSKILRIGRLDPGPAPAEVGGLKVVARAKALGVIFQEGTLPATADWPGRVAAVKTVFQMIAGAGLSVFGRGFAGSAYGVSQLLHLAEILDLPRWVSQSLHKLTSHLVNRKMQRHRGFSGVAAEVLSGHPSTGGLGALPWEEHITARRAGWTVRLALGSVSADWIHVGRALLLKRRPLGNALSVLTWTNVTGLPAPLARLVEAFNKLPRLVACPPPVGEAQYGPWCAAAPLWGNPLVEALRPEEAGPMEAVYHDLAVAGMRTEPHIATALTALETAYTAGRAAYEAELERRLHYDGIGSFDYPILDHLRAAWATVPAGWQEASRAARARSGPGVPPEKDALAAVARRLGWQHRQQVVRLANYTVKMGTLWLRARSPGHARQQALLSAFSALGGRPRYACMGLNALLDAMWRLPWENKNKEVFWLLALNGLPTAERMAKVERCACGAEGTHGRLHYFFECPVAKHLLQELQDALHSSGPLTTAELFKASSPPICHSGVWQVVVLAATDALWRAVKTGRRAMQRRRHRAPAARAGPDLAARLGRLAVAHFWDRIADFTSLQRAPAMWREECTGRGCFIRWLPDERKWVVLRRRT